MSWIHNGNFEEAVVAMQPEKNFIYKQIEFDQQQRQYFHPPQLPDSFYNAYKTVDDIPCTSSRSVAMQEKLVLMNRIQNISHTRPYGEHATLLDWNNSDQLEEETIGMMRYCGMYPLAEGNLDKDNTLPITVQTTGVYISRNGRTSTPIILDEGYFRPRLHNTGRTNFGVIEEKYCRPTTEVCNPPPSEVCNPPSLLRSDLDTKLCNPSQPPRSVLDKQCRHGHIRPAPEKVIVELYNKPPMTNLDRKCCYPPTKRDAEKDYTKAPPSTRGVVDKQLSKSPHTSRDYEQKYFNQPSNNVIQKKENFEPLPVSSDMAKEQCKHHPSDVLNKPRRRNLTSSSEFKTDPNLSGGEFNCMLQQLSHWHHQSVQPESSSTIGKVSTMLKKCSRKCCAHMENKKSDQETNSASQKPNVWSPAAEKQNTTSSSSSNSDYFTAKSSFESSFFSAHSSKSGWNEEPESVEEVNEAPGRFNKNLVTRSRK